jgi:hypothetical protein
MANFAPAGAKFAILFIIYLHASCCSITMLQEEPAMPIHPLVLQLRFARAEFARCLEGLSPEDGVHRVMPMNSIGWIVGHLSNQEHRYWVLWPQGLNLAPGLHELVGTGKPASTPPLAEMWAAWKTITQAADTYLDTLTVEHLREHLVNQGKQVPEDVGTLLHRNIYHYWFHTGEAHAIRQVLGHPNLPQFVGDLSQAPYRSEG